MPQFQNGAASVHYETIGSGPPLLLIAGTASDGTSWRPLLPLLAGRRLIMIDNRASGQTTVDGPVDFSEMIDDCAALLDHLGLGAVDVVGHSLGGYLGLGLAANHPDKVKRLVTMCTAPVEKKALVLLNDMSRLYFITPPPDWFRLLFQWLFSAPFFAQEAYVAAAALASTSYQFRQSPGDFARQIAALNRGGNVDLSQVRCDVLAVSADLDLLASPTGVTGLHAAIPKVRHLSVANAAHSVHWEQPQVVAEAINAFLS